MRSRFLLSAMLAVAMTASSTPAQSPQPSAAGRNTPAFASPAASFAAQAAPGRVNRVIVRFSAPVEAAARQALRDAGVELLTYIGDYSYFASVSAERLDLAALDRIPALLGAETIGREYKLHRDLLAGEVPPWAVVAEVETEAGPEELVAAYVVFHRDVALDPDGAALCYRHGAVIRSFLYSINAAVIELPRSRIEPLAAEDAVQWIEPPMPGFDTTNDSNRALTQANLVQAAPYNLTGAGVNVMVYDGGTARASHVDFQGRLTVRDSSGMGSHPTHVCGTVGGAGVGNAAYKGMAPGVTIQSYGFEVVGGLQPGFLYTDPGDLEADYNQAINTYGAVISNNSIGSNIESNNYNCAWQGDYGATSALIDAIVRGSLGQPFRVVWAAGNERQGTRCNVEGYGSYYSIAPPSGAKNHIAVGAVNSNDDSMTSFSSWGPTDDGRLKPDISAPGCQSGGDNGVTSCDSTSNTAYTSMCGTSMACPTTTGLAALMLQDYRAQFPGRPDFRNSTLKILLAHTAVDRGNVGPDYQFGYGSVRVKDAIDFMRSGNFLEEQVGQGETYSVLVVVEPGTPVMKVTLAWDDYPAAPVAYGTLVNDLDLRVYDPSNNRRYPWTLNPTNPSAPAVQTAEDHVNNIEQVLVNSPAAGVWRVEVYGHNVPQGPQPFSLCASPQLVACSSRGTVAFEAAAYGCAGTAAVSVVDCDLNTDSNLVETVTVTVSSTTEPAGETLLLTETGPETADFRGGLPLSTTDAPGVLHVGGGDVLTARYVDADDGQGGQNVEVTATAAVDCAGPVISNVLVSNVSGNSATVTFTTSEAANATVHYGLSCGALNDSATQSGYRTAHSLVLSGLPTGVRVYFAVEAVDESGNPTLDNNGGGCYSFMTPALLYNFPLNSNPGWTTQGSWQFGVPTGQGGNLFFTCTDPTSGHTGGNVYGYNLNGNYANSMSVQYLTTTALNCTGYTSVELRFWRNLGLFSGDTASLQVSNNGSTWTTLWSSSSTICDGGWQQMIYNLSAVADNQPTVYIRWGMGPTDIWLGGPGWNIDDIEIWAAPPVVQETCDDGILNQGEDRIDCGGPCPACECLADAACDDGLFCNGVEYCDAWGRCQPGADPCPTEDWCDEAADQCFTCGGPPTGDLDGSGATDGADIQPFVLAILAASTGQNDVCAADFNANGVVDEADVPGLVAALLGL